jgi:hypothetical protein
MSGEQELNDLIRKVRALPRVVEEALPEAARELEKIIAGNVAAQRGPDGQPWPKPKDPETTDVLRNAMKSVTVRAIGRVLIATVRGIEARHHLGIIRGRVKREIIPTKKTPAPMIEALKRVILRRLANG